MTETIKSIGFGVSCLIMFGFFMLCIFSVVKGIRRGIRRGIRGRKEELSEKDVLSSESSNGHDPPQALPPEYIQVE